MLKKDLIILTVDDDRINLKLLKSFLMRNSDVKEVIEAKNGLDAIDILKSRDDIHVVLLDMIMPIMGGLEMIQKVRANTNLRQIPIIVLTTDETKKKEAFSYGANEFLMKPIRNDDLIKKINLVLI